MTTTSDVDQPHAIQADILAKECTLPTHAFSPGVLPGPLQTAPLARALCSRSSAFPTQELVEGAVALRRERHRALMEGGPERTYVITPLALTALAGLLGPVDLAVQLDRLHAIAALAHVDLLVLPADAPVPWTVGFTVRAGRVNVEGPGGLVPVPESHSPAYEKLFRQVVEASVPYDHALSESCDLGLRFPNHRVEATPSGDAEQPRA